MGLNTIRFRLSDIKFLKCFFKAVKFKDKNARFKGKHYISRK